MPISAGLREDIAVYRGFIGQQYFVNYFRAVQNQYMLFWLLKDAQLACKRCPLSPLLTPF